MTAPWQSIDTYLAGRAIRFGPPTLGQTVGGVHTKGSLHYTGHARDYGRSDSDMPAILEVLLPFAVGDNHVICELFGLTTFWKNGRRVTPGRALHDSHQNHVHVGLRHNRLMPTVTPPPQEEPAVPDNPEIPNITGPVTLHLVVTASGVCTGYYVFSPETGEIHAWGPGATFHGRSEVTG